MNKFLKKLLIFISVAYSCVVAGLYLGQNSLLYHPDMFHVKPADVGLVGFEESFISSTDGTRLQLWSAPPPTPNAPTVVFFHGNKGQLGDRNETFANFAKAGFGVVALSYRGFGASGGSPSEAGIMQDAEVAIAWARNNLRFSQSPLIYYGESLGTGVAVRMAATVQPAPALVVLQSPYTSVAARAQDLYWYVPVRLLLKDDFDSLPYLPQVHAPLLVLHGGRDTVIPPEYGRTMADAANEPKRFAFFTEVEHTGFPAAPVHQLMRTMLAGAQ